MNAISLIIRIGSERSKIECPQDVQSYICQNLPFEILRTTNYDTFDQDWSDKLESHDAHLKTFTNDLKNLLRDCLIEVYHLTRVLNLDDITENGLKILRAAEYLDRMETIIKGLGFSCTDWEKARRKLAVKIQYESVRLNSISFFSPCDDYTLNNRDQNGYISLYGEVVGGEIAKQALRETSILDSLKINGVTALVETLLPFDSISREGTHKYSEAMFMLVACVLYANGYFCNDDYHPLFLCQIDSDLPANRLNVKVIK